MIKVKRSSEITRNYMYLVVNSSKTPFYEDHLLLNIQAFLEDEADHCCGLQMLLLYEWLITYLRQEVWQDMNGLVKAANDFPVGL